MVSLKLLASELLLACPGYGMQYQASYLEDGWAGLKQEKTLYSDIYVPGEITEAISLKLTNVRIYASPNNPGAAEVAKVIQEAIMGLELSSAPPSMASHFLLYLAHETFVGNAGEQLAQEVRDMMRANQPIVMLHENDMANGGVEFAHFFSTTPQDLIVNGLYKDLALAYHPGHFRPVSVALVAKKLGATASRHGLLWSRSSSKCNIEVALPSGTASSSTDLANADATARQVTTV